MHVYRHSGCKRTVRVTLASGFADCHNSFRTITSSLLVLLLTDCMITADWKTLVSQRLLFAIKQPLKTHSHLRLLPAQQQPRPNLLRWTAIFSARTTHRSCQRSLTRSRRYPTQCRSSMSHLGGRIGTVDAVFRSKSDKSCDLSTQRHQKLPTSTLQSPN